MNDRRLSLWCCHWKKRREEKRRELFFGERERKRKRKQKLSSLLETNQLDFFSLIAIHRKRKKVDSPYGEELPLSITFFFVLFLRNSIGNRTIYFNCRCADRMLSLIIILLFIQQFHSTEQLKTIQATLASTVELPCSVVNQTIESASTAKVNTKQKIFWIDSEF